MLADLPVLPNRAFQRKHHISWNVVAAKRRELGVPPPPPPKKHGPPFTDRMIGLLGKRTDGKLARNFKLNPWQIAAKRHELGIPSCRESQRRMWSAEKIALLGTMSDCELARRMGLSCSLVRWIRIKHGRAVYRKVDWTPEAIAMLGAMKDIEAAQRLAVSLHLIRKVRYSLGIGQFRPTRQGGAPSGG